MSRRLGNVSGNNNVCFFENLSNSGVGLFACGLNHSITLLIEDKIECKNTVFQVNPLKHVAKNLIPDIVVNRYHE